MKIQTRNRIKLILYSIIPVVVSYLFISYKVNTIGLLDVIAGVILAVCLFITEMRVTVCYKLDPDFQDAAYNFCSKRTEENYKTANVSKIKV